MLRNLMVTGVVSLVMSVTALAYRSLVPPEAEPTMDPSASLSQAATGDPAGQPASAMDGQQIPAQGSPNAAPAQQGSAAPDQSSGGRARGGMASGGQAGDGMAMCPCMQMMMQGGMGGTTGGQSGGQAATPQPLSNPRTKQQAKQRAEQHLDSQGNPNVEVGEVQETAASYEVEVVTGDGSLVNRLIIDKQSGEIKTQY